MISITIDTSARARLAGEEHKVIYQEGRFALPSLGLLNLTAGEHRQLLVEKGSTNHHAAES
jgi:hypothetical protein